VARVRMDFDSLDHYLARRTGPPPKGPLAILLMEDLVETDSTIRHVLRLGFRDILVLGPQELAIAPDLRERLSLIRYDTHAEGATPAAVNRLIERHPGIWMYYGYNAEYLFFPFCETRNIREMLAFTLEERRDSILAYVIDLYADDLDRFPDAVSLEHAHLDLSGYYALAREEVPGQPLERQLDFFGGIKWRFEEHVPQARRRIDRISVFRAAEGLRLRPDHTFNQPEYNTYACPWHNNLTVALCSFRTAKALKTNPGSTFDIPTFRWHNSGRFNWHSQQLMDLGLMEPGQWF
jgi:hypothetical protein